MVNFVIGPIDFSADGPEGPDSHYVSIEWELTNNVSEKAIPGKGNKFITIRTSDAWKQGQTGPLWHCTVECRCISSKRFFEIWDLVTDSRADMPYEVQWAGPWMQMYIVKATFRQDPGFPEPPMQIYTTDKSYEAFIGTWTLQLIEAHDG